MRTSRAICLVLLAALPASAATLKVMKTGLGAGTVTSAPAGINCGATCDATYGSPTSVTLTATPAAGSLFVRWNGDCSGTSATCTLTVTPDRSVRAEFGLTTAIPTITDFTPAGLAAYLTANPIVNTPARFVSALPVEFKRNWILMSRSESLQTGIAEIPRFLLPSADSRFVFTLGLKTHASYPASHPLAVEYMQWDAADKDFRFHEVVLDAIPPIGVVPARSRGVSVDDSKCSKCHSTRNVLNHTALPGTTGIPPGVIKTKNKPNWDSYDSWGGMLPFNRDRIYQGTVEAAAFRKILNPWTWRTNDTIRSIVEQLELQPPGIPAAHAITRINGGTNDGYVVLGFDVSPPVFIEPLPAGTATSTIAYSFNNTTGTPPGTTVTRGGNFVTLHHSSIPTSDEGRGVHFFDTLGGLAGSLNQTRIGDEVASHRFATGSVPIDVRPIALAITKDCVSINAAMNRVDGTAPLTINQTFFTSRNGKTINDLVTDTRTRAESVPRRKADIQKINLDRIDDIYWIAPPAGIGLIQLYGANTTQGTTTASSRIRQDVFRRIIDIGSPDATVMGGFFVDREQYGYNTNRVALYRYFLEPLGVSVDRWAMGVRGRGRTYAFADVFSTYVAALQTQIETSLDADPIAGLTPPYNCGPIITAVNSSLSAARLPAAAAVPFYSDVQRVFNKGCIECHGGLDYPPFVTYFPAAHLDLSEDEAAVTERLGRSYTTAVAFTSNNPATSYLYSRITSASEDCPGGVMPCGGPALSTTDIETIRRWIVGTRPNTIGDPHLTTADGTEYDFQAAGEFVLLRGENFEVQARQTAVATDGPLGPNAHTGLTSCVSINTAVAVRVGRHVISYQPNLNGEPNPNGLDLYVDHKLTRLPGGGIVLPAGGRILPTTAPGGIQIECPGGTDVIITPAFWDYYQVWHLDVDVRHSRATDGVIGVIAPGNWLPALPDGTLLGPRPADLHQRYVILYEKFAKAWRVTDKTSLFEYAPGTSTKSFTIESWPGEDPKGCRTVPPGGGSPTRTPPPKAIALQRAQDVCSGIVEKNRRIHCEEDVRVTGDPSFAQTYLEAQKILLDPLPTPPALASPPNDARDVPAGKIGLTWFGARDLRGDRLTYMLCVWRSGDIPTFNDCRQLPDQPQTGEKGLLSSTLTELKSGQAYFWKIVVQDGHGGTVESETRRFATK